MQIKAILL